MLTTDSELENYFRIYISKSLKELEDIDGGQFILEITYDSECELNATMKKHGLEVYGMSVRPTELEVIFELGEKYLAIKDLPIRYCRIYFESDGNYYINLNDRAIKKMRVSFSSPIYNFSQCSPQQIEKLTDEIKKIHLAYLLSH